ncbi:MAG: hypothetical protein KGS72_29010 [Cyanobacteria bacterium REEB67]|nr:hypothetical protein [Cyanobacteria bacterium REEB67]
MSYLEELDLEGIVNPIDRKAKPEEKLRQLQKLSKENEPIVDSFLSEVDQKYETDSKTSFKEPDKILEKANRPSILENKPWYNIERIRDSFSFKTVLKDLDDLPRIAEDLKTAGFDLVKTDTEKVLEPGPWGWRIAAFDLRMPNGQLVEYYLPVHEMEEAKKDGNHALFEKWRNRDLTKLEKQERIEFLKDRRASHDKYDRAWQSYLDRTKQKPERIREALEKTRQILTKERAVRPEPAKPEQKEARLNQPSKLIEKLKRIKGKTKEDDLTR